MIELKVGDQAPEFTGKSQDGKDISLSDYRGKNVILYFYPRDNTPGCTAEACNLRDNYDMWLNKGYAVIGVSGDSIDSHKKFADKFELPFPLIADESKDIMNSYGTYGEKNMYGKIVMGIKRTTFVLDQNGKITEIFKRPKSKDHTNQILSKIK